MKYVLFHKEQIEHFEALEDLDIFMILNGMLRDDVYILLRNRPGKSLIIENGWYRGDLTPVLTGDVPKKYRLFQVLLP